MVKKWTKTIIVSSFWAADLNAEIKISQLPVTDFYPAGNEPAVIGYLSSTRDMALTRLGGNHVLNVKKDLPNHSIIVPYNAVVPAEIIEV